MKEKNKMVAEQQNSDLVSFIVCIYNVEPYIRRSLDSLLAQTYTNIELILVDDGSPDNCGAICDEYARNDGRIKVIHQQNSGLSVARNVGLAHCTGDYILFADPDDWEEPTAAERLVAAARSKNADVATCDFYMNEKLITQTYSNGQDFLTRLLRQELLFSLWNTMFRRSFIVEHHIMCSPDWLTNSEDVLFIIRLLTAGAKTVHINEAFYHYIIRRGGLSQQWSEKKYRSFIEVIKETEKLIDASKYDNLFKMKRQVVAMAYNKRRFYDVKHLYPEITQQLHDAATSNKSDFDRQLARCRTSAFPAVVWCGAKVKKVVSLVFSKLKKAITHQ